MAFNQPEMMFFFWIWPTKHGEFMGFNQQKISNDKTWWIYDVFNSRQIVTLWDLTQQKWWFNDL